MAAFPIWGRVPPQRRWHYLNLMSEQQTGKKLGRPYRGGRQRPRYVGLGESAREKGLGIRTVVTQYILGALPPYVGRVKFQKRGWAMSRARWARLNGIGKESAERIQREGRLPAYVTTGGKSVLPTGGMWWEDSREWARVAVVLRQEIAAQTKWFKVHEARRRQWGRKIPALKAELTRVRREMDWLRYNLNHRKHWLQAIHMLVRGGLKARERGVLFLQEENAEILAGVRKEREKREKQSIGMKRAHERRRQAAAIVEGSVEPLTCAEIERRIASGEAIDAGPDTDGPSHQEG